MEKLGNYILPPEDQLRKVTLCLLVTESDVLLAMKKRRFGAGKWNGVGGKSDPGETIEETAIRETQEEIDSTPLNLERVATLNFYFPHTPQDQDWNQQVAVFIVNKWKGEPKESEEMRPEWFPKNKIPLTEMWDADTHWMPQVLSGKKLRANFIYNNDQQLETFEIKEGSF